MKLILMTLPSVEIGLETYVKIVSSIVEMLETAMKGQKKQKMLLILRVIQFVSCVVSSNSKEIL